MKKALAAAAAAAVALVPATSSADTASKAAAGKKLKINFTLVSAGDELKRVEDFRWKNFKVRCAVGGPVMVDGDIERMGINNNGKFDGKVKEGDAKVEVEGEVKQGGDKVLGTLKSSGSFGSGTQNCKTTAAWKAEE